ncbi:MAG TPA: hypothetical protein VMH80_23415 [Bryobacteraceae bacterium]|nr:hypothetical protein [Bryobacteraceae bacterium]
MVNRDEVIEYLLHEMPEAERTAFAERWFNEPELYESVRMAESGLLDDYVRHKVSRTQRRRIEQYLLGSEAQRRKLAFAAALCAALPQTKRWHMPWAAIAVAIVVAFAAGSAWLGIQNRQLRREVASLQSRAPLASGGLFTTQLPADTVRGVSTPNSIRLAAGASMLRLELELRPGDEQNVYTAAVSAGGRIVWSEAPVTAESRGTAILAPVWIPAGVLAAGDHTIELDVAGKPVAFYRFTVIR